MWRSGTTKRRHPSSKWHVVKLLEKAIDVTAFAKRRAPIRSWRVAFPLEDEMDTVGQPMILRHVARKDPCEWALNYVYILDDLLNEGATDRIPRNLSHLQFVHRDRPWPREWTMSGIITKETKKVSLDKNMVYNWRGLPWTIIRSSMDVIYRL